MITSPPSIGDVLYVLAIDSSPIVETCPDCLGKRTWHVSLPNGEEYDFGCARCSRGYEGSIGTVQERNRNEIRVEEIKVTTVEVRESGLRINHRDAESVYPDEASARADIPATERAVQERQDEYVVQRARNAARRKPRRPYPEGAHDLDGEVASELHSVKYSRFQIRDAVKEIRRWVAYAARKGIVVKNPLKEEYQ